MTSTVCGDGGQLELDGGNGGFAGGVDGDAAHDGFDEAFGIDGEVVIGGADADEVVEAVGGGFDGEQGLLAAGEVQIDVGARNDGAGSIGHGTRYAPGKLGI